MLRNYFVLILLAITLGTYSCKSSPKENFKISFLITGIPNEPIVLEEIHFKERVLIDSTRADSNGRFVLQGSSYSSTNMYRLNIGNEYMLLIIDNDNIQIQGKWSYFLNNEWDKFKIKGSSATSSLQQLQEVLYGSFNNIFQLQYKIDSLLDNQAKDSVVSALQQKFETETQAYIETLKGYADTTKFAPIAIYIALRLDKTTHFDYISQIADELKKKHPTEDFLKEFLIWINENRPEARKQIIKGMYAPEIRLAGIDNKPFSLSSLKGDFVLLDFWTSWCQPCKDAHKQLKQIYQTYKHEDLEVLSVSIDKDITSWKKAILDESLNWHHIIDTNGWEAPVVEDYGFIALPSIYLIDTTGKVIEATDNLDSIDVILKNLFK